MSDRKYGEVLSMLVTEGLEDILVELDNHKERLKIEASHLKKDIEDRRGTKKENKDDQGCGAVSI